ncbi:MAG: ABC transporter substrate-binding protein, partial [Alphaproteobacteria bacterium]
MSRGVSRRQLLGGAAAGLALAGTRPRLSFGAEKVVKVGFLAPLTGEVAGWGLPGLYGCEIWAEWVNEAGGIKVGDDRYMVELVGYDDEYLPDRALKGAKKLVFEDDVKIVLMLGGSDAPPPVGFFTKQKVISTTLLPSDLTDETLYHLAPCEVHPIYNV